MKKPVKETLEELRKFVGTTREALNKPDPDNYGAWLTQLNRLERPLKQPKVEANQEEKRPQTSTE
jgi:hypothetical protein